MYHCFSCSGFNGNPLLVHFIQGLRDHVPCVDAAASHTQQQTTGEDGESKDLESPLVLHPQTGNKSLRWKQVLGKILKGRRVLRYKHRTRYRGSDDSFDFLSSLT